MEEENFEKRSLLIDERVKAHLFEVTKWARFLAVLGIIISVIIAFAGLFVGSILSLVLPNLPDTGEMSSSLLSGGASIGVGILYVGLAVLYFIPCLYLYRFAGRTRRAMQGMKQEKLEKGMHSLNRFFRFVGILTIIYLIIMVLAIIGGAIGAMMGASFTSTETLVGCCLPNLT